MSVFCKWMLIENNCHNTKNRLDCAEPGKAHQYHGYLP